VFIYPLGFSLTAGFICVIAIFWGWRRTGAACLFAILAILWICSTPFFASFASRTLEARYPPVLVKDAPEADVAIVLGGGVRPPNSDNPYYELRESSDRIVHAVRLRRAGKVKWILVTDGGVAWKRGGASEGEEMRRILRDLGVDEGAVLVETISRNTYENALFNKSIWDRQKFTKGLLVTSARHMQRAVRTFVRQGYIIAPASTDAVAGTFPTRVPFSLLPGSRALDATTNVINEWVGLLVYYLRGRV